MGVTLAAPSYQKQSRSPVIRTVWKASLLTQKNSVMNKFSSFFQQEKVQEILLVALGFAVIAAITLLT